MSFNNQKYFCSNLPVMMSIKEANDICQDACLGQVIILFV